MIRQHCPGFTVSSSAAASDVCKRRPMLDQYLQAELVKLDGVMGKYNLEPNFDLADAAFRETLEK